MDWKLSTIKKDWLLGAKCSYSEKEILEGFSAVDKFLGKNFIETHWKGQRGVVVAVQIVDLGLNLRKVSGIKGVQNLVTKLSNKRTHNAASSELRIGAFFAEKHVLKEIYPSNPTKKGELDLKLSKESEEVYVEVTSTRTRIAERYLMQVANKLSRICKTLPNIRLEVYLYDILTENELRKLYVKGQELLNKGSIGTQVSEKGNYIIMISIADDERMSKLDKKKKEEESVLFVTKFQQKEGVKNITTVGVPFADKRAKEVLEREYHQLVGGYTNIIVIDISGVPKGMQNWPGLISRRLQSTINRKISAVLLSSSVLSMGRIETKRHWIKNPHAHIKLSKDFFK